MRSCTIWVMTDDTATTADTARAPRRWLRGVAVACLAAAALAWPAAAAETVRFVAWNLVLMAPVILMAVGLTAAIRASGADGLLSRLFEGRVAVMLLAASAFGAVTPICGVGVLPIIAGLLGAGVPLAPIMAFWLSSPITDPAMLAVTAATLGLPFAAGKTAIAFAIGLIGGVATHALMARGAFAGTLRSGRLDAHAVEGCSGLQGFVVRFWRVRERRRLFGQDALSAARLVAFWLAIAFTVESLLARFVPADLVASVAGADRDWAVPLAVLVGTPLYIDGYAALPMVRGLIDLGMGQGAAMALLVAGGITSLYASVAVFALLRLPVFLWYLGLAVAGSLLAGYGWGLVA